ncbi:MAG TPA: HD domain-containing protein [Candidatus Bilamarchaeum sp.]|nr:HD domain-containing protein [Candidatus Bilamarchaeum sp.]
MESVLDYLFEAGMLKRVKRSGWWSEKVESPESVAEHSFRAALIAFVLAKMEGLTDEEANRICTAAVFHDMHETRLLDLNKITHRYITVEKALERRVEADQIRAMPKALKASLLAALRLSEREERILKDADYLECAIQAKEYADIGYDTGKWVDNIAKRLQTASAKALANKLKKADSGAWKDGLKRD